MIPKFSVNTIAEFNLNINTRSFIKSSNTNKLRRAKWRVEQKSCGEKKFFEINTTHKKLTKNTKYSPDIRILANVFSNDYICFLSLVKARVHTHIHSHTNKIHYPHFYIYNFITLSCSMGVEIYLKCHANSKYSNGFLFA